MRPALPTALLALLVLVPTAQAGWFSEPLTLELTPLRVGDALRYDLSSYVEEPDGRDEDAMTTIVMVEGTSTRPDRFGQPRQVETFLSQVTFDDARVLERCHKLAGGLEAVQVEPLRGTSRASGQAFGWAGFGPLLTAVAQEWEATTVFEPRFCGDPTSFTGRSSFTEGERYRLGELSGGLLGPPAADVLSQPAAEERLHGRPALRIAFDVREVHDALGLSDDAEVSGTYAIVIAQGLPPPAAVHVDLIERREGAESRAVFRMDLEGWEQGEGAPLARWANATLPARNPDATFGALPPLALDDAAFAPAYPFAEALAALRADTTLGLDRFLSDHGDALLVHASYDRHAQHPTYGPAVATDGAWEMRFVAGEASYTAKSVRAASPAGPRGLLPANPLMVHNQGAAGEEEKRYALPPEGADGASLAKAAEAVGLPVTDIATLTYTVAPAEDAYDLGAGFVPAGTVTLTLSDQSLSEGAGEGLLVSLDALTGGVRFVADARTSEVPLLLDLQTPADVSGGDDDLTAASFLAGPAVGSGLGVTGVAATSFALLVLFVKFLAFPLYTRLVRARMLEHPVRAALMQKVRASPGVRLAELIRTAPVAESAVRRHLALLVRHGFLVELREGGTVSYYARGEVPPDAARQSALLRRPSTRDVYELLSREPGLSLREAGKRLGLSAPSVLRHRRMLEKAGLLAKPPHAVGARPR